MVNVLGWQLPADFPIQVDEATQTVTMQAGVPQRVLLDLLDAYRYPHPHFRTPCPTILLFGAGKHAAARAAFLDACWYCFLSSNPLLVPLYEQVLSG